MGDVAPLHDRVNGPGPLGTFIGPAHLMAVDPMSPADAPTHTSKGERSDRSAPPL